MNRNRPAGQPIFLLQLAVAVFFFILGLQTVMEIQNPGFFREVASVFAGPEGGRVLALVMGILALLSGFLLFLELLFLGGTRILSLFTVLIFLYWAIRIVLVRFLGQINVENGTVVFLPDLMGWLLALSTDVIILLAVWSVFRKYARR